MLELHHHPVSANLTILRGKCIEPFLDVLQFGKKGGRKRAFTSSNNSFAKHATDVDGRLCAPIAALPGKPICCLPCPATDWVYPESMLCLDLSSLKLLTCS
jgi:hypothetical protein